MRLSIVLTCLAAVAIAIPYPQEEQNDPTDDPTDDDPVITPTLSLPETISLDIPITDLPVPTRSKKPHWEPIPIFSQACNCNLATARLPCWATDALQKCHFEENFSYGCYMSAAGGCPTPTRICSKLFSPTPLTGRHPCDLGPAPTPTSTPTPTITLPTSVEVSVPVITVPPIVITPTPPVVTATPPGVTWPGAGNGTVTIVPSGNGTLSILPVSTGNRTVGL